MARGPRIDGPGAVQHVMLRGIERGRIFADDHDRRNFVARCEQIFGEEGLLCYAWALMPNHVHLVTRTGTSPLSRAMARLGTGYALHFNRRHGRVGHLFQNRFKSVLVSDDSQLECVVRYVHLNAVRARIVPSLDALADYPWSGHAALMGRASPRFLDVDEVLGGYAGTAATARRHLLRAMRHDLERPTEPQALDSPVEPRTSDRKARARRARSRRPRCAKMPSIDALIDEVCTQFAISRTDLTSSRRTRLISRARARIARRSSSELALPATIVAQSLGLSPGAVSRARSRDR